MNRSVVGLSDPETEMDLILSRAGIFETSKDIDDFTIFPTRRSNLATGVGWIRGCISRCRVPKEVYGHGKGRVKSIPKAYWGIGKLVPQTVRKTLENSYNLATYHLVQNYASRQT